MTESDDKRYHHGDLRRALIDASLAILQEQGIERFTLRAAARRAGVSAGAPAHHFGNIVGLLTAVAVEAYDALGASLDAIRIDGAHAATLRGMGRAYVQFAITRPAEFRLMFRKDLVAHDSPEFVRAARDALSGLGSAAGRAAGYAEKSSNGGAEAAYAAWSLIHGLAHLAVEDKLSPIWPDLTPDRLLDGPIAAILQQQWPDGAGQRGSREVLL